ncbi:hypothetical protein CYMTET_56777 [Cymbomonas tetramitiformis]|uniref:Uncharacterized protein n=1 Tax=Cymbomonas tetramitiformis TaxID=36881 RepID=A0AAE0ELM3_9CHLO|nr:hypothetical protein CYMTET_56777 [Cymbomonas tetramitiformis]
MIQTKALLEDKLGVVHIHADYREWGYFESAEPEERAQLSLVSADDCAQLEDVEGTGVCVDGEVLKGRAAVWEASFGELLVGKLRDVHLEERSQVKKEQPAGMVLKAFGISPAS